MGGCGGEGNTPVYILEGDWGMFVHGHTQVACVLQAGRGVHACVRVCVLQAGRGVRACVRAACVSLGVTL